MSSSLMGGPVGSFGTGTKDPMVGQLIGGVNVFGGGLAIYGPAGKRLGAIGVSGDTSCTDHAVAWETRHALGLDYVPGGDVAEPATTTSSTTSRRKPVRCRASVPADSGIRIAW
jgi:hypothetical protein